VVGPLDRGRGDQRRAMGVLVLSHSNGIPPWYEDGVECWVGQTETVGKQRDGGCGPPQGATRRREGPHLGGTQDARGGEGTGEHDSRGRCVTVGHTKTETGRRGKRRVVPLAPMKERETERLKRKKDS
jgi:hypothetical protein